MTATTLCQNCENTADPMHNDLCCECFVIAFGKHDHNAEHDDRSGLDDGFGGEDCFAMRDHYAGADEAFFGDDR